jgi:hypothetical protein
MKIATTYDNPGTALTYGRMVEKMLRRSSVTGPFTVWKDVEKGLEMRYATIERRHALDITKEKAMNIIANVRAIDVKTTLCRLAACGARCVDQQRLHYWQVSFDDGRLRISFRLTKNRRAPQDKFLLSIRPWFDFPEDVAIVLRQNEEMQLANCQRVNNTLKALTKEEANNERHPTSYSFRRLFVHTAIEEHTENGFVEWQKVIEWTGHKSPEVVKAYYQKDLDPVEMKDESCSAGIVGSPGNDVIL